MLCADNHFYRNMGSLWRVVILLSFAWLSMQGVQAHAYAQTDDAVAHGSVVRPHAADAQRVAHVAQLAAASCADESAEAGTEGRPASPQSGHHEHHHQHGHCVCCMTACGVHCGALLAATFSFSAQAPDHSLPRTHPVTRYDGVTRAPPVRPPIV